MADKPFSATRVAHLLMAERLSPGDRCIDATAGNGHDTVFLRQKTGERGLVAAIDIQAVAIESTRNLLRQQGLETGCRLIKGDHAQLLSLLGNDWLAAARVICFNLGYLPGGDKQHATQSASTLAALQAALAFLAPGGLLAVTAYPGHREGASESEAVAAFMSELATNGYFVNSWSGLSTAKPAPVLYVVRSCA
jgi:16S rRNA C1402 N4-methylase RsmH